MLTVNELFAGIGAFRKALSRLMDIWLSLPGYQPGWSVERNRQG